MPCLTHDHGLSLLWVKKFIAITKKIFPAAWKQAKGIPSRYAQTWKTRRGRWANYISALLLTYAFCLPSKLFTDPTCTVILDKDGKLLGAKIASDGQWRFPDRKKAPYKFAQCLIQYEDRQFYSHPGVNPAALFRAVKQDLSNAKVVSGGSTLTMQLVRISRKNPPRNVWQKCVEIVLATRVELDYSKEEILALYASHAPFGSNVVGIDAASWRYFGRDPDNLSWAESATLAVLPNSPSLIYPGKNQLRLKEKRDRLLDRLKDAGIIDCKTRDLAKEEPLPGAPHQLPRIAPHLLDRVAKEGMEGQIVKTTIDIDLQEKVNGIIALHHAELKGNQINNAAAIVLDVETGNVLAYCGNTNDDAAENNGDDVDVIMAPRSTGSILKPFLYAGMLTDGQLLPNTLVADIPTDLSGYNPQNFNRTYDGAVPARRALARSLNVPAVRMLQQYRVEKFHSLLQKIGLTTINQPPDHYGLSLILGGAEGKLWDLAGAYASMARTLNHYNTNNIYDKKDFHAPTYLPLPNEKHDAPIGEHSYYDASAIWFTFDAMTEVVRPDEEVNWTAFLSSNKIAWKTGTSFGFRDGWAIGVTPKYVVAVWVGNADGEGRPGLIGVQTAAPILFDIFSDLRSPGWFKRPDNDMVKVNICKESGYRAGDLCDAEEQWIPKSGLKSGPCPYHRMIHLDASGKFQVTSDCEEVSKMQHAPWFVLPPAMEYYYKTKNPSYKTLPPFKDGCGGVTVNSMDFVYPRQETQLYIPTELDGRPGKVVFEIAHRKSGMTVYWHLDDQYMGMTKDIHQFAMNPDPGAHTVTCVDENGESISMKFEVVSKKK
ncbi:MAG: penicillin-binding protein 1C [Bacteroidetes bacterium]|nr:penicillin-binding protein 1C [Bacteroidota bacterium]